MADRTVAVVGAGLAGLRTAEGLRRLGFTGRVVVVGDEVHMPYTRPPLSKKLLLADGGSHADVALKLRPAEPGIEWRLGHRAVRADLDARSLLLDDGTTVAYDALVAATGVSPRRLPAHVSRGTTVLRTLDHALELSASLTPGTRVVVVGAGFIGCEVAAAAIARGASVTVVALDRAPMLVPLGPVVGAEIRRRHEASGVVFRLGVGIERVEHGRVVLATGETLPADVVVEAIGSSPNTGWLDGNGLDLTDGVLCDAWLRMGGRPDAVAAGDLARFPNVLFDDVPRRVEHWQIATESATHAARTVLAGLGEADLPEPFTAVPSFSSDQQVVSIRSFGLPGVADSHTVDEGDLTGDAVIGYRRDGVLVGGVLIGMARGAGPLLRRVSAELRAATPAGVS